jgi:hypothetical protein
MLGHCWCWHGKSSHSKLLLLLLLLLLLNYMQPWQQQLGPVAG